MAGFRATPSRRITVLYGMIAYVIRINNPLFHRLAMLRNRRLEENRGFPSEFLGRVWHHAGRPTASQIPSAPVTAGSPTTWPSSRAEPKSPCYVRFGNRNYRYTPVARNNRSEARDDHPPISSRGLGGSPGKGSQSGRPAVPAPWPCMSGNTMT